ncbi:serpin-zx [Nicotiana attenuata]|uniref:Serpin-zx n=1 Tax=Nicotiana attenuata TaxID=49451 RepID=A0A314LF83_NICAT|nr:serpin-zx [Nicotiana attenuata]
MNMFQLRKLFQQQRDVSLKLARHVFFSDFEGHQSVAKVLRGSIRKQTDVYLTLANRVVPTTVHKGESNMLVDCVLPDGSPSGGPRLSAANSVCVDQCASLKPSFKQIVDNVYKATSLSVDFAYSKPFEVVNQVNQWVEKETAGLVKEILPVDAVDHLTRLVFVNSLYFKGVWGDNFNASMTKDSEFYLLNGTSVQVPFMSQTKRYVKAYQGFKVLRLPYKKGLDRHVFLSA